MTVTELLPLVQAPTAFDGPQPGSLDRATALAGAGADTADTERRLSPAVIDALTGAGFASHFVPRHRGGREGSFRELFRRAAAVGEGCASAGWCAALYAAHGRFAAYLPQQGQRELWEASPDVRIAAGVMPPSGTAARAGDGWRLSGEWACVSGLDFADWVLLAAVEQVSGQVGGVRVFAVPARDVTVLDTWHSTGVRGTGSNTAVVRDVWVPGHRTFPLAELLAGTPGPGRARCHAVPAMLGGGLVFAAAALGAARQALAAWTGWATGPGPGGGPLRADGAARAALARSSAETEAARLLLEAAAVRADTVDPADAPAVAEAVAVNRRDAAVAVDLLVTAVERLFRTGGVHARSDDGVLQRCWRDLHTIATHGVLRLEPAADAYATAVAGI